MKVALGSDHAGFAYKEKIREFLPTLGHEAVDFGTHSPESCDYPDFIRPAATAVADGTCQRGIVLGGSGNGEAIVANKVCGVRCGLAWNVESAQLCRAHNDANVLSLGERMMTPETALAVVKVWLETPFDGGRHARRVGLIEADIAGKMPAPQMSAEQIIALLGLQPHPKEGGFFRETYRSGHVIPPAALPPGRYAKGRAASTCIYYLLTPQTHSRLHRLGFDEIFHFYLGDPVTMLQLRPDGTSAVVTLGAGLAAGQQPQVIVPAGTWQGACLAGNDSSTAGAAAKFALLGTTVAPGFDFADYESADPAALAKAWPNRKDLIGRLA